MYSILQRYSGGRNVRSSVCPSVRHLLVYGIKMM